MMGAAKEERGGAYATLTAHEGIRENRVHRSGGDHRSTRRAAGTIRCRAAAGVHASRLRRPSSNKEGEPIAWRKYSVHLRRSCMRTLRLAAAVAVVTVAFLTSGVASAHHSRAGYDTAKDRLTTLNGVIAEVIWRNPHVYVTWDSKDDKGAVVRWTGELSSPPTMLSEGLSKNTFKPGDPLMI